MRPEEINEGGRAPPFKSRIRQLMARSIYDVQLSVVVCFLTSICAHYFYYVNKVGAGGFYSIYHRSDAFLYFQKAWFKATFGISGELKHSIPDTPFTEICRLLFELFGVSVEVVYIFCAFCIALSSSVVNLVSRELFNERTAWFAGLVFALSGPLIFFSGLLFKTSWIVLLVAVALYGGVRFFKKTNYLYFCLFCSSMAVAGFDRENVYVIVAGFLGVVIWKNRSAIGRLTLQVSSCVVLLISITFTLSGLLQDKGVKNSVGVNFLVGNAPGAAGGFTYLHEFDNDIVGLRLGVLNAMQADLQRDPTWYEWHLYGVSESWDYYKKYPLDFVKLKLLHAKQFSSIYSYGHPENFRDWRYGSFVLTVSIFDWGVIFSLAVIGVYFYRRLFKYEHYFLMVSAFLYLLSVWFFLVVDRYRLPLFVFMIPFSAFALQKIIFERKWVGAVAFVLMYGAMMVQATSEGYSGKGAIHAIHEKNAKKAERIYSLMAVPADQLGGADILELAEFLISIRLYGDAEFLLENMKTGMEGYARAKGLSHMLELRKSNIGVRQSVK